MMLTMVVFADVERKMIGSGVQKGIDAAIADGKRVGWPPFGYTVEEGFLQQIPIEYVRAQAFIREVCKGREKHATAGFFEIPDSAIQSILERTEANYDIPFDNDQGRLERAKVNAGEKEIPPLDAQNERRVPSAEITETRARYAMATITIIRENTPIVLGIEPVRRDSQWETEAVEKTSQADLVERLLDQSAQHVVLTLSSHLPTSPSSLSRIRERSAHNQSYL